MCSYLTFDNSQVYKLREFTGRSAEKKEGKEPEGKQLKHDQSS